MPNIEVVYTRGFCASSTEKAVQAGLAIYNPSSEANQRIYVPGVFFSTGQNSLYASEGWAINAAQKANQVPLTMKLTVNRENFASIKGAVHTVFIPPQFGDPMVLGGRNTYEYQPVNDFEQLTTGGQVVIKLDNLSAEDLITLHCEVGRGIKAGRFIYQSFEDLARRYLAY